MDYTQWTWERLKFEWKKQKNYVPPLIWGTFSGKKTDVLPEMHFYITVGCRSLAWSSGHIKGNTGLRKSFFLLVAILRFRAVTLDMILILTHKVRKLTPPIASLVVYALIVMCDKGAREAETSVSSSFLSTLCSPSPLFILPVAFLITGAGNRSHGKRWCNRVI